MSDFSGFNISAEVRARLEKYQALLEKWQARINLVASDTLPDVWDRHFVDSLQIIPYLPTGDFTLVDMGSGAGFPGLVLAIACPNAQIHLIESDAKKCEFLKTVSRETGCPVMTHHGRIETIPPFFVDVMTARALAPLSALLAYALPYTAINPGLKMVFLKGAQWQDEVQSAQNAYIFDIESHESLTSPQGRVLIVSALKRK